MVAQLVRAWQVICQTMGSSFSLSDCHFSPLPSLSFFLTDLEHGRPIARSWVWVSPWVTVTFISPLYYFPSHLLWLSRHLTIKSEIWPCASRFVLAISPSHIPTAALVRLYVLSSSLAARLCCTHLNLRNQTRVLFLIELPVLSSYNHWTLTTVQLPEININFLAKYVLHISLAGQTLTLEWWVEVSTCLFYWHGSQYISCPSHITLCGWDWVQRVI